LEQVKSHYIFGDTEYLKKELEKKGGSPDNGANPGGSSGRLRSEGQTVQGVFSMFVGAFFAYLVKTFR
jgi:hypothetical protein